MQFVLVNGGEPRSESSCVMCYEPIGEGYLREIATRFSYCGLKCYATHFKLGAPTISSHIKASDGGKRIKPALPR